MKNVHFLFLSLFFFGFMPFSWAQLPAPAGFVATGFGRHIELTWEKVSTANAYEIWRADEPLSNFNLLKKINSNSVNFYTDWTGDEGDVLSRTYKIRSVASNGNVGDFSPIQTTSTFSMDDNQMMEMVQKSTFRYFWESAHPVSGMAKERNTSGDIVATGGTGFGVMSMVVAAERAWKPRADVVNRLLQLVSFLQIADRFHGVFPHWMNGNTGDVVPFSQFDDGADLVETAFLMQGLLTARAYFSENTAEESALRDAITGLWEDVEWDFFRKNNSNTLYWHWSPNYAWQMNFALKGFNETQICYILGAASPTHPIPASLYHSGWAAGNYVSSGVYFGYPIFCGPFGGGPMFFAHYSFLGFDPRNKKDAYCNYFTRNTNHARIQQAYAISNPENHLGYSEKCWGLTASDDPWGYLAHDIFPTNDNGTIAPTAALASMPYTPVESMAALHHFYEDLGGKLWGDCGFYDAFNENENWFATSYLAIDQGPIIALIENHRTGLLWDMFMKNPEIEPALEAIGFVEDLTPTNDIFFEKENIVLYPNPAPKGENIHLSSKNQAITRVEIIDSYGRSIQKTSFSTPSKEIEINTKNLNTTIFLIKIYIQDGKTTYRWATTIGR